MKLLRWVAVASVAIPLPAAAQVSQRKPSVPAPPAVYAHLAYSSEGTFREITIRGRTITWRHNVGTSWMDEQKRRADEESRRTGKQVIPPMAQQPWWTDTDIKTDTATLTDAETESLAELIRRSGFLKLAPRYRAPGRAYPTTISATVGNRPAKTVIYESGPGAPPKPAAFATVAKRITTLTAAHFPAFDRS